MDPLTLDEFLGTNDTKTEGKRLAYITGKSEGVKALLKDIFAEAGVPTVGDNDLVDLDPPLFLPASDLVRFLCKTDMLSESFAQKLPLLCLIVFSSAHCSYRTSNPIPLNPQEKAFLSVTQTAAYGLAETPSSGWELRWLDAAQNRIPLQRVELSR